MGKEKPFYLRPPWEILFKETKLDKISPWNIDLVHLLSTLLEEMNRVGMDFRAAGTAINSSVLIYLKKAELLLKMEEPPDISPQQEDVYLPPPLDLPFRFEFTTTTLTDLIVALEKALTDESRAGQKPRPPTLPEPLLDLRSFEAYLHEIEESSDSLLKRIRFINNEGGSLTLSTLISGSDWPEVIKIFIMLLFLAQRGRIDLQQDENETDISISLLVVDE
jgi:chromatin segregation and condensation protein Rec8/ScpA/Scc1 (kleisin family)